MKEYLLERDGKYELHKVGIVPDGAIEVPEGTTDVLKGNLGGIFFYRGRNKNWMHGEWVDCGKNSILDVDEFISYGAEIIWKRPTQPEELPFVDDEPKSINEKCEKMENLKIKVNSEAESKEIQELLFKLGFGWHGAGKKVSYLDSFSKGEFSHLVAWSTGLFVDVVQMGCGNEDAREITLPELRQLAGGKSLNDQYAEIEQVRQTLNERKEQYGSFEDVAMTTQKIMDAIAWARGSDKLPAPHQEALHMIASKIARIVNGDYNHKDSWHDIQGYAKLIEDLIG